MVACLTVCAGIHAQEIVPFRLVNVDGYVQVSSQQDKYASSQAATSTAAASSSTTAQSNTRSEVFLMTHSYVYHPNFLSLDVGGGPVLQQIQTDSEAGQSRGGATLYNFSGRAAFLNQKPTHGSVFYEHLNPTITLAPGQVMNQQTTRQGFDFASVEPSNPIPVYVNFSRTHTEGKSPDRVIDDRIEQLNVTATRSLGEKGNTRLQVQTVHQESQSGNPNLAIQATNSDTHAIDFNATLHLGDDRQYTLTNLLSQNAQAFGLSTGYIPDRRDMRWLADLRARHSEQLSSFVSSNYSTSQQGELGSTNHNMTGGLTYQYNKQLATNVGLLYERTSATQFNLQNSAFDFGLKYQPEFAGGNTSLNYSVRYEQHAQTSLVSSTSIIGEKKTLSGLGVLVLDRTYVIANSVVVSDSAHSQTFLEGRDYILTVVGNETRIQRVAGGNIFDGQDVLVDYRYDIGGSYGYSQLAHTASMAYSLTRYTSLNMRLLHVAPELSWGTPAYTLNHVDSTVVGLRTDYPFNVNYNASIGLNVEGENRRETVLASRSFSYDAYIQSDDPWGTGNMRLTTRQNKISYANATTNVDLRGLGAHYWTRIRGVDISSELTWERDTGGPELRRRFVASAKAQWRLRLFSLSFNLSTFHEESGPFSRSTKAMSLNLRRDL